MTARVVGRLYVPASPCAPCASKANAPRVSVGAPYAVTPDELDSLKARVKAQYQAIDHDMRACAGLSETTKKAWAERYQAAMDFAALHTPSTAEMVLSAATTLYQMRKDYEAGERLEEDVAAYQKQLLATQCGSSLPPVVPEVSRVPPSPSFEPLTKAISNPVTETLGSVKTIAICGVVIAVIVGIKAVTK
jgi:hypothetical protein